MCEESTQNHLRGLQRILGSDEGNPQTLFAPIRDAKEENHPNAPSQQEHPLGQFSPTDPCMDPDNQSIGSKVYCVQ
jgi:hypothetical protein